GSEHTALDRRVAALDARRVQEARLAADEAAAREGEFRQRVDAAGRDRSGAVRQPLAALEHGTNCRMRLVTLEFFVRRQVRITVIQTDDEADGDLVVAPVIEERPAVGIALERPAG